LTAKRPPRKPQDRKPQATVSTLVDGPIEAINLDEAPAAGPEETVHLFTLHGVDYYIPAEPKANISLQFMRRYREDPIEAQGWILEAMLGEEAYTALAEWEGFTNDHLRQIVGALTKILMGGVEDATRPLGRS
jgi:hypothetical protein